MRPAQFVTFGDFNDPISVIQVVSHQKNMEKYKALGRKRVITMEQAFGEGIILKGVDIEITDAPVSVKIDRILPWLEETDGG